MSFRRGPRSPTRSPLWPLRTNVPRSPTAEARTESRACMVGQSQADGEGEEFEGEGWPGWSKEGEGLRRAADWGALASGPGGELLVGGVQRAWRGGAGAAGWTGPEQRTTEGGGASLTSSSSGGRRGWSSRLSSRTGARLCSRSLRSAPSAAPTSLASPSPSAPKSAGSSVFTCRTCRERD